ITRAANFGGIESGKPGTQRSWSPVSVFSDGAGGTKNGRYAIPPSVLAEYDVVMTAKVSTRRLSIGPVEEWTKDGVTYKGWGTMPWLRDGGGTLRKVLNPVQYEDFGSPLSEGFSLGPGAELVTFSYKDEPFAAVAK